MKPEARSKTLLAVTRSKAKMYEYNVPESYHIKIKEAPEKLFDLTIGILGELSALYNNGTRGASLDNISDLKINLRFSAHFFDAYLSSHLNTDLDQYLLSLGSAAYYLSDLPGSSTVLINLVDAESLDLGSNDLESLLCWLLNGDFSLSIQSDSPLYGKIISQISTSVCDFFSTGELQNIEAQMNSLRSLTYCASSPRELLLADIACAVLHKRIDNSTWNLLPKYSGLVVEDWRPIIEKDTFMKELWPAQKLLGDNDVFKGKSAIVQMPTSAGKTRATELIIRSAFLSDRSSLAIIVAPFRALCHEIHDSLKRHFSGESVKVDELSDVIQKDFDIKALFGHLQVIVVTPEKLNYILRHEPGLANNIKLIIYDEGHLFDDTTRGVTYELLLASLKSHFPEETQTILISAVINNAEDISHWLLHGNGQVISGTTLTPTYRTVAFASWKGTLGRLEFVRSERPDMNEYFVPRVISQHDLKLKGRERKLRRFPGRDNGGEVALYLGLKLICNGSVAIFTGRKDSATNLCETIVEKYDRELQIDPPSVFSDSEEIKRLVFLYKSNLGNDASATIAASLGIFMHHGNTPQGIRLAVEHALQEGLIRFVICTSTLAQGVNLPLRYLIISNARYGKERIKTRDFHNLIGRAGRSGMYTEGSVLFTNPKIYDLKSNREENWRWKEAIQLLSPDNSEPCSSYILKLFDPLRSDDSSYYIKENPIDLIKTYIKSPEELENLPEEIGHKHADKGFTAEGLRSQIASKLNTIAAIESYLMANLSYDESETSDIDSEIESLVEETLAFYQAKEDQKEPLKQAFKLLADNIISSESDVAKRKVYSQTLFGINECKELEVWVTSNLANLNACSSTEELFDIFWPLLFLHIKNTTFKRCSSEEALQNIALSWIEGRPLYELFKVLDGERIGRRIPKIDHVVDICVNAIGFDGSLIIGAASLILEFIQTDEYGSVINHINELQKRLKYGLPTRHEIVIFELGFADRPLALELAALIKEAVPSRTSIIRELRVRKEQVIEVLNKYPSYFRKSWDLIAI